MLVGHLPHLARLAAVLLADDPERPVVAFQQGGLVGLEQRSPGVIERTCEPIRGPASVHPASKS